MTLAVEHQPNIAEIPAVLGLADGSGEVFFGRILGFPVGAKVIDPYGSPLVLCHVRQTFQANSKEVGGIAYAPDVKELIDQKQLEIEHEDTLTWVSLIDARGLLAEGRIRGVLESVLKSFADAGLNEAADLCHYCRREPVPLVRCVDEKVVQVCDGCYRKRTGGDAVPAATREELLPALVVMCGAAVLSAIGWGVSWAAYVLLFSAADSDVIVVPRLVQVIAVLFVAIVTGWPVGFVIKRLRRRKRVAVALAAGGTLLGVSLGEIAFVTWLIFREVHTIDVAAALQILPSFEMDLGMYELAVRVAAAIAAIVTAVETAKPPKPKSKF